jgi:hypothetical protein
VRTAAVTLVRAISLQAIDTTLRMPFAPRHPEMKIYSSSNSTAGAVEVTIKRADLNSAA